MILVEHDGVEYALITQDGKMSWVNARNRKASGELSMVLRKQASLAGVSDFDLEPPKPKEDFRLSFKTKQRRPRKKKGGIAVRVKLKNKEMI
jgi:hypothetical protein